MSPRNEKMLRQVNFIRFILPLVLFTIVLIYENWEHIPIQEDFRLDIHFNMEVLFFGVLGPAAVFSVLTSQLRVLRQQISIGLQMEELNRTLENKVADRTEELALRNRELAQLNGELKELDQLKSDFVSLVSHELRGPLTTLNGGLEMALESAENLPPEPRRILEIMSEESQRLTEFVQTILDISRLQAGKLNLRMGPVALQPLLERTSRVVLAGKDRPLKWELPESLLTAWADETSLEKIFCNLLNNAEKYSPPEAPIEIAAWQENGTLKISVTDHGIGIASNQQPKIFERFLRLERGDRIHSKGWGLGLFFSKILAEGHGGDIQVRSPVYPSPDQPGSTFILSVPSAQEVPEDA